MIKSKTHGYLDYLVGVLLIAAPWLFDFYRGGAESWVPVILGASTIVYSLITDYEMGATRVLPYRAHLTIDLLSGIFLASSPWMFGFSEQVYLPHLLVGILEISVVAISKRHTSIETRTHDQTRYSAKASAGLT